tara:strand:- start:1578 stop:1712 length:135 start_codon:yes stop_codon:yes gene_type:complete
MPKKNNTSSKLRHKQILKAKRLIRLEEKMKLNIKKRKMIKTTNG